MDKRFHRFEQARSVDFCVHICQMVLNTAPGREETSTRAAVMVDLDTRATLTPLAYMTGSAGGYFIPLILQLSLGSSCPTMKQVSLQSPSK